jgi:hypothetical protein
LNWLNFVFISQQIGGWRHWCNWRSCSDRVWRDRFDFRWISDQVRTVELGQLSIYLPANRGVNRPIRF